MAGLVAASELARAVTTPSLIEAQQRVGGRVLTLREPFAPGLWAEAGAMRLPRSHRLTMALIERFGLPTQPFTMDNDATYCFFGGTRCRRAELHGDPEALGFEVTERERVPPAQLWATSSGPSRRACTTRATAPGTTIAAEFDQYAVREFLELREWSEGAIEMFGLLFNQEALMNSSFLELLREEVGNYYTNLAVPRRRHRPAAARVPARGRPPHPLRREDDRDRPVARRRDRPLPHRRRAASR